MGKRQAPRSGVPEANGSRGKASFQGLRWPFFGVKNFDKSLPGLGWIVRKQRSTGKTKGVNSHPFPISSNPLFLAVFIPPPGCQGESREA